MPGTLFVVSTPIGNLEDITLRALRVLREVSVIAAEDTRHTAKLLTHFDIHTPTTSLHAHNEHAKAATIVKRLEAGQDVALVSDAGTPLMSDPGALLIREARAAGVRVVPIPGASSILAALAASGADAREFTFLGFPPVRSNARLKWFAAVANEPRTVVFFEAPHRVARTLTDLNASLGTREVVIARELTKLHEELVIGPINSNAVANVVTRGEFTFVIPPRSPDESRSALMPPDADLFEEFGHMTTIGSLGRRAAVVKLAARYGAGAREVYAAIERAKLVGQKTEP